MSFFVTSVGKGDGANYGGLAGADAYCQQLAAAAGRGNARWVAYLSTQGPNAVHARDRIGTGPWYNAKGQQIAANVAELHGDTIEQARLGNRIQKTTALNEKGEPVNGVGDTPNVHDILTGSTPDGRAYTDSADHTCSNYTSDAEDQFVMVGHYDRAGTAPISAVITLSCRIIRLICRRVVPTARSIPSSRVRSKTDSASVLTIPKMLITTDRARRT